MLKYVFMWKLQVNSKVNKINIQQNIAITFKYANRSILGCRNTTVIFIKVTTTIKYSKYRSNKNYQTKEAC